MVDYKKTEIGGTRLKRSFDVAFLTGVDVNVKSDVNDVGDALNPSVDDGVAADAKVEVKAGGWDISRANLGVKKSQTDSINVLSSVSEGGNMLLKVAKICLFTCVFQAKEKDNLRLTRLGPLCHFGNLPKTLLVYCI